MDCTTRLMGWANQLESVKPAARTHLDDFTSFLSDCPQICDAVYGTKDFDLGGIGVYTSFAINIALFISLGLLQSFVSYLMPQNTSSSVRLAVTRAQLAFDKAYGIGTFLHFGIIVFTVVRLYANSDPIGTYERSAMQDLLEIIVCLQTLAVISYMVHRTPSGVKAPSLQWEFTSNWFFWIFTTVSRDWLKSKLGELPLTVISRLCEKTESSVPVEERHYPHVVTPDTGYIWLIPIFVGFSIGILLVVLHETVRHWFWLKIKKAFTSMISRILFFSMWTALSLAILVHNSWHFIYIRDSMLAGADTSKATKWDFGQVFVVLIWLPACYQLVLAVFVSMQPPRDEGVVGGFINILHRIVEMLYEWHLGSLPKDQDAKSDEPIQDRRPAAEIREQKVKDEQFKKWTSAADEKAALSSERSAEEQKVPLTTTDAPVNHEIFEGADR